MKDSIGILGIQPLRDSDMRIFSRRKKLDCVTKTSKNKHKDGCNQTRRFEEKSKFCKFPICMTLEGRNRGFGMNQSYAPKFYLSSAASDPKICTTFFLPSYSVEMDCLPTELQIAILETLPLEDLWKVRRTCYFWNETALERASTLAVTCTLEIQFGTVPGLHPLDVISRISRVGPFFSIPFRFDTPSIETDESSGDRRVVWRIPKLSSPILRLVSPRDIKVKSPGFGSNLSYETITSSWEISGPRSPVPIEEPCNNIQGSRWRKSRTWKSMDKFPCWCVKFCEETCSAVENGDHRPYGLFEDGVSEAVSYSMEVSIPFEQIPAISGHVNRTISR